MAGYKMKRDAVGGEGERLDTIDYNDDEDDYNPPADLDYGDDDQENNMCENDDEDVDSDEGRMKRQGAERIEVNLDDVNDDEDNE